MRIITFALIIFCVALVSACVTEPMRTPNVNDPSVMLPEKVVIEGIRVDRGQSFRDCVPVSLEAVFKFYGKIIDRKEIDEQVQKSWGTKERDWMMYVKGQGFNVYSFYDRTKDKRGIKFFLAQHLPVLVTGSVGVGGWLGHMVILVGYDDRKKIFYIADPEWRSIQQKRYLDFEEWHKHRGSWGYVVYPQSQTIQKPPTRW